MPSGNFKFRTPDAGAYPTREDIIRAIDHGAPGVLVGGIPSFAKISSMDRHALSEIVAGFANIPHFDIPISIPPRPSSASVEQGRTLYIEYGCASCHGEKADGNGVLAADLVDVRGMPAQPANLTSSALKGGSTAEDIWTRIYVGIDGTPMPSFGTNLSVAEIWSLVDFVISVRVKGDEQ